MPDPPAARGLDTNVLLRYLLADDADQHAAAIALIEGTCTPADPGLVHPVTLCEAVWALRAVYKVPKPEIVATLRLVLGAPTLRVVDRPLVQEALALYAAHACDFADALLHAAYRREGSGLVTFDRKAAEMSGARRLA